MALNFLENDEPRLTVAVDSKCRTSAAAQTGVARFNRMLNVLGIVIPPAQDDQVLEPSSNEELAIVQKAQVTGAQKWTFVRVSEPSAEGSSGFVWAVPVALGDAWSSNPNLTDFAASARCQL